MKAAIYARKSTEQNVAEDAKSVTRQIELARAFAEKQGWTVAEVYQDDGISGAEFKNRPGFAALLVAAESAQRPFDCLVMMDGSRLGRDLHRTGYALQQLQDAGVQVWYYQEARQAKMDDATGKFMESVRNFANEMEHEKAKVRRREALRAKASKGFVASGKVYGYTNVRTGDNTTRQVNDAEAAIVRRVFELTASGLGMLKIARALNAEGVISPSGALLWGATSLREVLKRELYCGRAIYGRTKKVDKGGTKVKVKVPVSEWLTLDQPELRIVSDELWQAAHARQERTRQAHSGHRKANGELHGRPESGLVSRHLLAGFLRCGICGANMFVAPRASKVKGAPPQLFFLCTAKHKTGSRSCTNRWALPYETITQAILDHYREDFLRPEVIGMLLTKELEERHQDPAAAADARKDIVADVKKLDRELANLTAVAAAGGGDVAALVEAMKAKQRQRNTAAARLEHLDGLDKAAETWDVVGWLEETRELLEDIKATLESDPAAGRHVLRATLTTAVKVTPALNDASQLIAWDYEGRGALDKLMAGRLPASAGCTETDHNSAQNSWEGGG